MKKILLGILLSCVIISCEQEEVSIVSFIKIPSTGSEKVTKVSYRLTNGTEKIEWEGELPVSSLLEIDSLNLLATSWDARIILWMDVDKLKQKVYRLQTKIDFNNSVIELPTLESGEWIPFDYVHIISRFDWKYDIGIFSPRNVDPRKSFYLELDIKDNLCASPSLEKYYVIDQGSLIASTHASLPDNCELIQTIYFPDIDEPTSQSDYLVQLRMVLFLSKLPGPQFDMVTLLNFEWKIKDHQLIPGGGPTL